MKWLGQPSDQVLMEITIGIISKSDKFFFWKSLESFHK